MATGDTVAAKELLLYIENDGDLYRQQGLPILKNLVLKIDRGVYDHERAVKLYGYLVENGARKYTKEFAGTGDKWNEIFNKPTREAVSREFVKSFETEYKLGAYDHFHVKKYTGKGGALKNSASPSGQKLYGIYSKGKFGVTFDKNKAIDLVKKHGGQVRWMYRPGGILDGDIPSTFSARKFKELSKVLTIEFQRVGMNPRPRKYMDVYIVQGNYGQGWEDLTAETSWKEAKARLHEYNENELGYAHRRITRKVKIKYYEKGNF